MATEVDKNGGVAVQTWVHDCKTHQNHQIIFAAREHGEGWDYYLLTPECRSIEDGVFDDFMPFRDFLKVQFDCCELLFNQEMTLLNIDEVIEKYDEVCSSVGWKYLGR